MSTISNPTAPPASVDRVIQLISSGESTGSSCSPDLVKGPWEFDAGPTAYGPGSSMGDVIPTGSPRQGTLPSEYKTASDEELDARVRAAKATLGDRVLVLGHFYQRD
ncbi:MAG TPA: quinolinate synthase NadA, partial [Microterricola sp.]